MLLAGAREQGVRWAGGTRWGVARLAVPAPQSQGCKGAHLFKGRASTADPDGQLRPETRSRLPAIPALHPQPPGAPASRPVALGTARGQHGLVPAPGAVSARSQALRLLT